MLAISGIWRVSGSAKGRHKKDSVHLHKGRLLLNVQNDHTGNYDSLDYVVLSFTLSCFLRFPFSESILQIAQGGVGIGLIFLKPLFFSYFSFHSPSTGATVSALIFCFSLLVISLFYFFSIVLMLINCLNNLILPPFLHLSPVTPP